MLVRGAPHRSTTCGNSRLSSSLAGPRSLPLVPGCISKEGPDVLTPDVLARESQHHRLPMATVPGALLLAISSPYARRGVLWDAYRRHFGRDGDPVLVWQASSRAMNPGVDP